MSRLTKARRKCEHEGCKQNAYGAYQVEDDPQAWLCWQHARDAGFCPACGGFWAGVESFDFNLNGQGVCDNCEEYDDDDD